MNVHVDFLRSKISAEANVGAEILSSGEWNELNIQELSENTAVVIPLISNSNSSNPTKLNAAISFNEDENNLGVPSITAVLRYIEPTSNEPAAIMQSAAQNVTNAMLEEMTTQEFSNWKATLDMNAINSWDKAIILASNFDSISSEWAKLVLNNDLDQIDISLAYTINSDRHIGTGSLSDFGTGTITFTTNNEQSDISGIFSFLGNASSPELLVNLNKELENKAATILHTDFTTQH